LISATWFVKKDPNSKEKDNLEPIISEVDSKKIENLYQMAVEASSSFGQGIDAILNEEVDLEDESKVVVAKINGGDTLCMKKKSSGGWIIASSQDLQRGFGSYTVEGEDDEMMLGPVRHVMFVVHGIGEALWSREDVKVLSLREELDRMRSSVQKRQIEEWRTQCERAKKAGYV
jgi:hypothetical protein